MLGRGSDDLGSGSKGRSHAKSKSVTDRPTQCLIDCVALDNKESMNHKGEEGSIRSGNEDGMEKERERSKDKKQRWEKWENRSLSERIIPRSPMGHISDKNFLTGTRP